MHDAVLDFVASNAPQYPAMRILDIGGRDINGTAIHLFPADAMVTVVDLHPAPNVDIVGDITELHFEEPFDVVLCLEVLEHAPNWKDIIASCAALTDTEGWLIATAAGPGRPVHSGIHGNADEGMRPGEWYENIDPIDLQAQLDATGMVGTVEVAGLDVRVAARWTD